MQRKNIISLNLKNFLIDYIKPFAYIIYNQNFKKLFKKKISTIVAGENYGSGHYAY